MGKVIDWFILINLYKIILFIFHFLQICFWLLENQHRVMIAACDTFRSGAVEQLRTHVQRLKALHPRGEKEPEKVILYDKGYGKDAAAVSMEAVNLGKWSLLDNGMINACS